MISLRNAFGRETTTIVYLMLEVEGYYDDNNLYQKGGYGEPIPIYATPIPIGDTEHGTHGETLKAEKQGERTPATMKFHSIYRLPINSLVLYHGLAYKIVRNGDYSAAGFWSTVGATDTTVQEAVPLVALPYPEGTTILWGKIEVPIERVMKHANRR